MLLGHYSEIRLVQGTEVSPFLPKYSLFLSSILVTYLLPFFLPPFSSSLSLTPFIPFHPYFFHVPFHFILFFHLSYFYLLSFFLSFSPPSISTIFFSFLPSFLFSSFFSSLPFPSLPFSLPAKDFISCIYLMQNSYNSLMSFLCC